MDKHFVYKVLCTEYLLTPYLCRNVVQADRYQLLHSSHSHRTRIDALIGCLLLVSYSSSYHRSYSRVMGTVNCRGTGLYQDKRFME